MKHSESLTNISAAIVAAQSEMQGAKKDSANPFFKSKYADLGAVMAATKDALHNHGLSIMQFPIASDGMCGVETVLIHTSGEFISQDCLLACSKQDPQAYGSAITYARRYGWQSVCGIPSEDDDGNATKVSTEDVMDKIDKHKDAMTPEFRQWCMDNKNKKAEKVFNTIKERYEA